MRLGLVLDQIIFDRNGRYSTDEAFIRFVEAAAGPSFDRIDFCSRVFPREREAPFVLDPDRFSVRRLPWYPNVATLCLKSPVLLPRIARLLDAWLSEWDMVMACGVDPVTALILQRARRRAIPAQLWIRGDLLADVHHKYVGLRRVAAHAAAAMAIAAIPDGTPVVSMGRADYPFLARMGRVLVAFSSKFGEEDVVAQPRALPVRNGPFRVLYVGRISAEKGVDGLIDAMEHLAADRRERFTLTVVGADFEGSQYGGRFRARVESSRVRFLVDMRGFVPYGPRLWDLYDTHDVLVLPSFTEGFPQVLLEGMARGIPAVATAVGGVPTLVRDGENGLLVPPGRPKALADAIVRLIHDPELYVRLSNGGLVCAAAHSRRAEVASINAFTEACLSGTAA